MADALQGGAQRWQAEQRQHQRRLHQHRADGQLPREPAAVLRQRPAKADRQSDAHQALRILKTEHQTAIPSAAPKSANLSLAAPKPAIERQKPDLCKVGARKIAACGTLRTLLDSVAQNGRAPGLSRERPRKGAGLWARASRSLRW